MNFKKYGYCKGCTGPGTYFTICFVIFVFQGMTVAALDCLLYSASYQVYHFHISLWSGNFRKFVSLFLERNCTTSGQICSACANENIQGTLRMHAKYCQYLCGTLCRRRSDYSYLQIQQLQLCLLHVLTLDALALLSRNILGLFIQSPDSLRILHAHVFFNLDQLHCHLKVATVVATCFVLEC